MIDVRDSFFQADPFDMLPAEYYCYICLLLLLLTYASDYRDNSPSQFYAFKGVESKTIENCGWNSGWVCDKPVYIYFF